MQTKATVRYHCIPIKTAKKLKNTVSSVDKDRGQLDFSNIVDENVKCHSHSGKQLSCFLKLTATIQPSPPGFLS